VAAPLKFAIELIQDEITLHCVGSSLGIFAAALLLAIHRM
jgi:hypothetical protein